MGVGDREGLPLRTSVIKPPRATTLHTGWAGRGQDPINTCRSLRVSGVPKSQEMIKIGFHSPCAPLQFLPQSLGRTILDLHRIY